MSSRTKRSAVWEYYTLNLYDESKVLSCSVCAAVISRGGKETKNFNTSNMHHHRETKHPEDYKEPEAKEKQLAKEKECNSLGIRSNQPTLIDAFARSQPPAFDHPRAKEICKRIGEMIVLDNEPFTVVNHIGFNRLMKLLGPRYQLPLDKYFSETLIPEMYQKGIFEGKGRCFFGLPY